jgi:hypothetical protein
MILGSLRRDARGTRSVSRAVLLQLSGQRRRPLNSRDGHRQKRPVLEAGPAGGSKKGRLVVCLDATSARSLHRAAVRVLGLVTEPRRFPKMPAGLAAAGGTRL